MKGTTVRVCTIVYCLSPLSPSLPHVCVRGEPHVFLRGEPRLVAPPALGALFTLLLPAACLLLPPSLSPLSLRAGVNDRVWPTD